MPQCLTLPSFLQVSRASALRSPLKPHCSLAQPCAAVLTAPTPESRASMCKSQGHKSPTGSGHLARAPPLRTQGSKALLSQSREILSELRHQRQKQRQFKMAPKSSNNASKQLSLSQAFNLTKRGREGDTSQVALQVNLNVDPIELPSDSEDKKKRKDAYISLVHKNVFKMAPKSSNNASKQLSLSQAFNLTKRGREGDTSQVALQVNLNVDPIELPSDSEDKKKRKDAYISLVHKNVFKMAPKSSNNASKQLSLSQAFNLTKRGREGDTSQVALQVNLNVDPIELPSDSEDKKKRKDAYISLVHKNVFKMAPKSSNNASKQLSLSQAFNLTKRGREGDTSQVALQVNLNVDPIELPSELEDKKKRKDAYKHTF
ncbi:hypothetical protein GOP47_0014770 [Adiantum capillus-veneris]|uniref:Uncharacterized protein n=1 Tax=Adiantum capillus-veneris TaxID=13818 RepID=A0A9D4UMM3_ADICA|nr:hypothetical protein GOP47_0014770 [Adiantum capillus-veneris]